jgi:hypothetical protein
VAQEARWVGSLTVVTRAVLLVLALYLAGVYGHFLFNGMAFDPNASAYVIIKPEDTDIFLRDFSSIAKKHGLDSAQATLTPEDGRATHVFEARGRAMRIYAQNVLLSGEECVDFPGVGSDPGQFVFNVLPAIWLPLRGRATSLFEVISQELSSKGYRIAKQPSTPCDSTRRTNQLVPPNNSLERTREG